MAPVAVLKTVLPSLSVPAVLVLNPKLAAVALAVNVGPTASVSLLLMDLAPVPRTAHVRLLLTALGLNLAAVEITASVDLFVTAHLVLFVAATKLQPYDFIIDSKLSHENLPNRKYYPLSNLPNFYQCLKLAII